ncbi:MAG: Fic family protein [Rhodospirillales bacterium]|nr:Fic family protein [Rhodospirillales bacterium]
MADESDRHSKADSAAVINDPDELAKAEALNALRQFDMVSQMIDAHLQPDRPFNLRPSMIMSLHRIALEGINSFAGIYRPAGIEIGGSKHTPPNAHLVPSFVEEMCDYVNQQWSERSALHLAAYVMWRLNWIHPFSDGNRRTSRLISYLVLCLRLGYRLPGTNTIPAQIAENKKPYYEALELADLAAAEGRIDLYKLEELLGDYLSVQLVGIYKNARGENCVGQAEKLH